MSSYTGTLESSELKGKGEDLSGGDRSSALWPLVLAYAGKSTIHGVPSTVNSQFYSGQRYVWMLLLVVAAAGLTTVVTLQLQDYFSYPSVINVEEEKIKVDDVPDITFCSTETLVITPFYNPWTPEDDTSGSAVPVSVIRAVQDATPSNCSKDDANLPGECYLEHVMKSRTFILMTATWAQRPLELFNVTQSFIRPVVTRAGRCEQFQTAKYLKRILDSQNASDAGDEPFEVILATRKNAVLQRGERVGMQITLHSNKLLPVIHKEKLYIPVNHACSVTFALTQTISLTRPYKSLLGKDCVDTGSTEFSNPLARYSLYTQDLCKEECLANFTVAECGCRFFLDSALLRDNSEKMCDSTTLTSCVYKAREETFPSIRLPCLCPPTCSKKTYQTSISCTQLHNPEYPMIHVSVANVGSMKVVVRQKAVYSTETLLSTVGGIIGLFLGFSLVSCVEFLELLILTCKGLIRKGTRVKHRE